MSEEAARAARKSASAPKSSSSDIVAVEVVEVVEDWDAFDDEVGRRAEFSLVSLATSTVKWDLPSATSQPYFFNIKYQSFIIILYLSSNKKYRQIAPQRASQNGTAGKYMYFPMLP